MGNPEIALPIEHHSAMQAVQQNIDGSAAPEDLRTTM